MDWMGLLSKVLETVLVVAVPPLVVALLGLVIAKIRTEWQRLAAEKPELAYYLEMAADVAVGAAEQMGLKNMIKDKKLFAIAYAEKWLAANGLTVDLDLIEGAIEAAVIKADFPHVKE